jgi:hypothetical protein
MISNWNDFSLEQDVKKFIHLIEGVNESKELENLMDSLSVYLEEAMEKGYDYLGKFLKKVFKFFSKKTTIVVFICLILITRLGLSPDKVKQYLVGNEAQKTEIITKAKSQYHKERDQIKDFLKALSQRESSDDPTQVNKLGYIGKYQFGKSALKEIGLDKKIKAHKFEKNPNIWPEKAQDKAMTELLKKNKHYLGDYLSKYDGKKVGNIKLTKSGMLAGAHLLGASNVKKFINSNGKFDPVDGFGTHLTEYLRNFAGYNLASI